MGILAKVGEALQRLLGDQAQAAADASGVIERNRKFTAVALARTFVLGFLRNPKASAEPLAPIDDKKLRDGSRFQGRNNRRDRSRPDTPLPE